MLGSLGSPAALLSLVLIGGTCALVSLSSWIRGAQLLVVAILFGGIIGAHLGSNAIPILFRDGLIVLPIYTAFFLSRGGRRALLAIPGGVALGLCLWLGWLGISLSNPNEVSGLQLLIGLKVWALYIPMLVVGIGLALRPEALFRVLRAFLILGLVACSIGLVQSFLIRVIGYDAAIKLFFGEAARAATQGFAYFNEAGGVYRVPGTFSFTSQYVGFLHLLLTVTMIEANADPDPWYRRLGQIGVFVAFLAGVVSGTKGALVTFPIFIAGYFVFGLLRSRFLIIAPIAIAAGATALYAIGVRVGDLFSFGVSQARQYGSSFIWDQLHGALQFGAMGNGIGSSTNAARYVRMGAEAAGATGFESYYAKTAAELGSIGLAIAAAFFATLAVKALMIAWHHRRLPTTAIVAPIVIYLFFLFVGALKGPVFDVDPANVFFWLMLGLAIGIDVSIRRAASLPRAALAAEAPQGGRA